jgi:hypothetical protein
MACSGLSLPPEVKDCCAYILWQMTMDATHNKSLMDSLWLKIDNITGLPIPSVKYNHGSVIAGPLQEWLDILKILPLTRQLKGPCPGNRPMYIITHSNQ